MINYPQKYYPLSPTLPNFTWETMSGRRWNLHTWYYNRTIMTIITCLCTHRITYINLWMQSMPQYLFVPTSLFSFLGGKGKWLEAMLDRSKKCLKKLMSFICLIKQVFVKQVNYYAEKGNKTYHLFSFEGSYKRLIQVHEFT